MISLLTLLLINGCKGAAPAPVAGGAPPDNSQKPSAPDQQSQNEVKIAAAKDDEKLLITCLDTFRLDCDRYPTQEEGLMALAVGPTPLQDKWKGPYSDKLPLNDPWGHDYVYKAPRKGDPYEKLSVISLGSDGKPGGTGEAADIIAQNP